MGHPLSARQMEVLHHIARGDTNDEIAKALGVNLQTAKNHVRTILQKLDARNRAHAAVIAVQHGWVSPNA